MGTRIELDSPQHYLVEPGINYFRTAQGFVGKNRVKYWPSSQSITLAPINGLGDFIETTNYEYLKFRLSDCIYSGDWWTEVPEGKDNESDYFFHNIIKKKNYAGPGSDALTNMPAMEGGLNVPPVGELTNASGGQRVTAIQSASALPENTGYYIRFKVEGRESQQRSELWTFYFGQFALTVNSTGDAQLRQTVDFKTYNLVFQFSWAPAWLAAHARFYRLRIIPHGQRYIEFNVGYDEAPIHGAAQAASDWIHLHFGGRTTPNPSGTTGGTYRLPGPLGRTELGDPLITVKSPWTLRVSREYKQFIQVSRIGYFSGVTSAAKFWDEAQDIGFVPKAQLMYSTTQDLNGGAIEYSFFDGGKFPVEPFFSNNGQQCPALSCVIRGVNDLGGANGSLKCSSRTPEFYSYTITKDAIVEYDDATPTILKTLTQRIDLSPNPDTFKFDVQVDNSLGQANDYRRRGFIPCRLLDDATGITYSRGYAVHTTSTLNRNARSAETLRFSCVGRAERLKRTFPFGLDWTQDPRDDAPVKRPFFWQQVVRDCFQAGSFAPSEVVFDPVWYNGEFVDAKRYDFRLWAEGDGGGPSNGSKDGPNQSAAIWAPAQNVPIYEFMDMLIKDILGWTWRDSRADGKFHVYKRPTIEQFLATTPKAAFFTDDASYRAAKADPKYAGIPCYKHSERVEETRAPKCTTIGVIGSINLFTNLPKAVLDYVTGNSSGADDELKYYDTVGKSASDMIIRLWDNPKGYRNPLNDPPDRSHPDFMQTKFLRRFNLMAAPSLDAFMWIGRRTFEDNCFGYTWTDFIADWGDEHTYDLADYDPIYIDGELFYFRRAEPNWTNDRNRRARYTAVLFRPDAPAPR